MVGLVKCVEGLELRVTLEQNPTLKEPRKRLSELVSGELPVRYGEDIVKLFECPLFGFYAVLALPNITTASLFGAHLEPRRIS